MSGEKLTFVYSEDFLIPPKFDFMFKAIFGQEENKDILSAFLSAVLKMPLEQFEELEILNSEISKDCDEEKKSILDVRVRTAAGENINIEIQLQPIKSMAERIVYYLSKMYIRQLKEGEGYNTLKKCISINILDFQMVPLKKLHSVYQLYEREERHKLTDVLEVNIIEIPKMYEGGIYKEKEVEDWLKFLEGRKEEIEVLAKENKAIGKAYNKLKVLSKDDKARLEYEAKMAWLTDEITRINEAKLEGLQEGRLKQKVEIAQNMVREGIDIGLICKVTGFSKQEIEEIKKNIILN